MDSVRSALRLGADEAVIVYRRTIKEMTARVGSTSTPSGGVEFHWLTADPGLRRRAGLGEGSSWSGLKLGSRMRQDGRARFHQKIHRGCDAFVVAIGPAPIR
jgi:hypothetical protein